MQWGLPLMVFIELVVFDSSELEFGTSINSRMLVWTSEKSPSGSWMSSYVPSTSDMVSMCNAVDGFSEMLKYSFPSLKSCYPIK